MNKKVPIVFLIIFILLSGLSSFALINNKVKVAVKNYLKQYPLFSYEVQIFPFELDTIGKDEYQTVTKGKPLSTYKVFRYPWQDSNTKIMYEFVFDNETHNGYKIILPPGTIKLNGTVKLK